VVIHKHAQIGQRCVIRAQVIVGGARPGDEARGVPVIGNDVVLGVGAKILGPVRIGDRAMIGANAVVIDDVPDDTVVAGVPARIIRSAAH